MPQVYLEKLKANVKQRLLVEMENSEEDQRKTEYGYCHCGCGRKTKIAVRKRKDKKKKIVHTKGKPIPFIFRHQPRGENNPKWKGNNAGYDAIHLWVEKCLGKPSFCSNCGATEGKKFEWANISKKYKRDLRDYKRLCTGCHRDFDGYIKINWKKACEIRQDKKAGMLQKDIAKKYNLSEASVSGVIRKRRWKTRKFLPYLVQIRPIMSQVEVEKPLTYSDFEKTTGGK